jgi:integrase
MPKFPQEMSKGGYAVKIYKPTASKPRYRLDYTVDGKRFQPTFRTFELAQKEATRVLNQLAYGNKTGAGLSGKEAELFIRFKQTAQRKNLSLEQAIAEWTIALEALPDPSLLPIAARSYVKGEINLGHISVQEAVDQYLDSKRHQLRKTTFKQETFRLGKFAAVFKSDIGQLDRGALREWLNKLKDAKTKKSLNVKTKNHYRATLKTFLSWCIDQDYLPQDTTLPSVLKKERVLDDNPIQIYTPGEFKALLDASPPHLKLILAIEGLCGLRASEALQLEWMDIKKDFIEIAKTKAKTRSRRLVPICQSLKLILDDYPKGDGPIWEFSVSHFVTKSRITHQEAGIKKINNGLRHSFISYRLAITANENQTATEAGNSPNMIFQHYRELVTKEEAEKWFDVL